MSTPPLLNKKSAFILVLALAAWTLSAFPVYADISTALRAYWSFDEGAGAVAADSSGNGYNGTLQNGPTWTAGKINQALSFDGGNDVVSVSNAFDIPSLPLSISVWVNPSNYNSWREIFSKRDSYTASNMRVDLELNSGTGRVKLHQAASGVEFTYAPPTNTWTHLVVVAAASGTTLFVNGALQQTLGTITLGTKGTAAVRIGDSGQGDPFLGKIDDLRIYGRALSATDVAELYAFAGGTSSFNLALSNGGNKSVIQGGSITNTITSTLISGTTTPISFSVSGLPAGASASFSPASCSPSCDTTLTINTNGTTPLGPSNIVVIAVAGVNAWTTSFTLSVTGIVDNTPPTGSVLINGGATATKSRNSILTLSAADDLNAVTQMRFSNTGASYSTAEAYATTKAWFLSSGTGAKTVFVQFKDSVGNWSQAFTDTIIYDTTAPAISAVNSSNITSNSAAITWTTNEPATSQVDYGLTTSYGNTTALDTNLVTNHYVAIAGLNPQTTYRYRVRSQDAAANERVGSSNSFKTLAAADVTPPSIPANLKASVLSSTQINLSWDASTDNVGVTGYSLFRNGLQIASPTANSYQDSGLAVNTSYSYAVSARDAAGNFSAQSAPVNVTTPLSPDVTPPTIPANLVAVSFSSSQINLSWSASTDDRAVAGYRVYRNGSQIAVVTGGTAYSDAGLSASTAYSYNVSAYDAAGNVSAQSSPAIATTQALPPDTQAPSVPANLKASVLSSTQINLSWDASTDDVGVTGYHLFRNGLQIASPTATSYQDAGLAAHTNYSYTVSALDAAGNSSAQSGAVGATTLDIASSTAYVWPNCDSGHPCVIQHMATNASGGQAVNGIEIKFPNPTLSGNALVLGMTHGGGVTVSSVTDNQSNIWVQGLSGGNSDVKSEMWYALGANAGVSKITVTFSAVLPANQCGQFTLSEIYGVSAIDGAPAISTNMSVAVQPGPVITSYDGDLIYNYAGTNYAYPESESPATAIVSDSMSSLLSIDLADKIAAQFSVQNTAGSINPTLYVSESRSRLWNSLAIAFRFTGSGALPSSGIRIVHVLHTNMPKAQFPASGNLILLSTTNNALNYAVSNVHDSKGNSYQKVGTPDSYFPQIFYAANAASSNDLQVTWAEANTSTWYVLYDIAGAASSPLDVSNTAIGVQANAGDAIFGAPTITPTTPNGLIIALLELGTGPPSGPATDGMIMDSVWAIGMTDGSDYDTGDGFSHLCYTGAGQISFDWHMANGSSSSWDALGVAFKAAASSGGE